MSAEAADQIGRGLLAELALDGSISGPLAPSPEPSTPPVVLDCRTRRHQIFLEAGELADIQARARLLKTVPGCP